MNAMRRKTNHKSPRRRFNGGGNNGQRIKNLSSNRDKYLNMARDALSSGDRIESEYYLQHAEHYTRVLNALQEEDARHQREQADQADDQPADTRAQTEQAEQATPSDTPEKKAKPAARKPQKQEAPELAEAC